MSRPSPDSKSSSSSARPWVIGLIAVAAVAGLLSDLIRTPSGTRNTEHSPQLAPHRATGAARLPAVAVEDAPLSRLRKQTAAVAQVEPDEAAAAWETLVNSFSAAELPWILDQLANTKEEALGELRQLLFRRWATADPAVAAAWAAGLSDPALQKESLGQVAVVWHQADPAAALAWAAALPEGAGREAFVLSLGYEVAREEPVAALRLAVTLPESQERDDLQAHGISQWAAINPAAAARWADLVADESLRQQMLATVTTAWADSDSLAAANFALSHLPVGAEQDRAIVGIVQRLVQIAPESAAEWVAQFPALPVRDAALQNLVTIWAEQNLEAPAEWLQGLSAGGVRDKGISVYAQVLAPQSLSAAQLWTATIQNADQRALCEASIGRLSPVSSTP